MEELMGLLSQYGETGEEFTEEQLRNLSKLLKQTSKNVSGKLHEILLKKADEVKGRLLTLQPFTDDELVYAAWTRCECGAGMAYPKDIGFHGSWICSEQMTNPKRWTNYDNKTYKTEDGKLHSKDLPFSFWSVKSEGQPSANGATTRPKGETENGA